MAVQPCRECGQTVSTEATSCPHCGAPAPAGAPGGAPTPPAPQRVQTTENSFLTRSRGCGDIVIFGPILLILLVALGMCAG